VFGFDVHSSFIFETLREPGGRDPLEIVGRQVEDSSPKHELVVELDEPALHARIYHDGATYRLWLRGVGWFDVDPRIPRIAAPPGAASLEREEVVWGLPALLCFLHRGDASLHAAAVEVAGAAILLVAPQAHGKSTLAAAFGRRGHRILSEDLTCIRLEPSACVIPGPASLRLRDDVAQEVEVPFGRMLGRRHGRTRYALDDRGDCGPVPLRAVLLLHPSDDEISLEPVEPRRTLRDLWQSSFWLTESHRRHSFECVAGLANEVPIMKLRRPLRTEALAATVDHVLARLDSCGVETVRTTSSDDRPSRNRHPRSAAGVGATDAKARLAKHVVYEIVGAETIVLDFASGSHYALNATAGRMLELLERSPTVGEAAKALAAEYGRGVEGVARDIHELCRALRERGLLEFVLEAI
jgi:hypothetical protein